MYEDSYYTDTAPAPQDGGGLGGLLSGLLGAAGQVANVVKTFKGGEQQNNQAAQQAQIAQAKNTKIVTYVLIGVGSLIGVGFLYLLLRKKG